MIEGGDNIKTLAKQSNLKFMNIQFVKQYTDLNKAVYSFWYNEGVLILDSYYVQAKDNKKQRNYRTVRYYERLNASRQLNRINEEDVPLTSEIRNEALLEFHKQLTVKTWSEYKKEKYREI